MPHDVIILPRSSFSWSDYRPQLCGRKTDRNRTRVLWWEDRGHSGVKGEGIVFGTWTAECLMPRISELMLHQSEALLLFIGISSAGCCQSCVSIYGFNLENQAIKQNKSWIYLQSTECWGLRSLHPVVESVCKNIGRSRVSLLHFPIKVKSVFALVNHHFVCIISVYMIDLLVFGR